MNRICELFNIKYPIIQGGMVWASGWELVAAVSNAGGLGLLGAGSMYPEVLRTHIRKTKAATQNTFGVNVPLMYPQIEEIMDIIIEEGVKVVFTSAGSPKKWTHYLQKHGIKVAHVVSSSTFAQKAAAAGVDAIVTEGFEAGGHNGREETTSFVLIPAVRSVTSKPLIAAGGIASGRAMSAAMVLGADAVQIGSLFVTTTEASAHHNFKEAIIAAKEGDTFLRLKKLVPTRLLRNEFADKVLSLENAGTTREELSELLGKGRAKLGMFEGDKENGELEIGQVSALINEIKPTKDIMDDIISEYQKVIEEFKQSRYDF